MCQYYESFCLSCQPWRIRHLRFLSLDRFVFTYYDEGLLNTLHLSCGSHIPRVIRSDIPPYFQPSYKTNLCTELH
ncbi:Uncharacterized protein HZ326_25987 [Fusarium oxysporum f. sp. albedinis]|nr:Uncharacterized protein HZ326_25987 [Fusarium oxysporum f. sp. albedinis]